MRTSKNYILSFFFLFIANFAISQQTDCINTIKTNFHKDTASHSFNCMKTNLVQEVGMCNRHLLLLDTAIDISTVYELGFYIENTSKAKVRLSFSSGSDWSNEVVYDLDATTRGRNYKNVLPIYVSDSKLDFAKITKVKVVIESDANVLFDELSFRFEKPIKEIYKPDVNSKRLKEVKADFDKKNKDVNSKIDTESETRVILR